MCRGSELRSQPEAGRAGQDALHNCVDAPSKDRRLFLPIPEHFRSSAGRGREPRRNRFELGEPQLAGVQHASLLGFGLTPEVRAREIGHDQWQSLVGLVKKTSC